MADLACDLCDFTSLTPQGLGRHKASIHGIPGASRQPKKKRQPKQRPPETVELPVLGERVQVTLLAMDPETGEVTVGLNGKWRAVLK